MAYKIQEAARVLGTTVRTLHYYDQIGLMKPAGASEAGYRLYGQEDMARLNEILFFREAGFSLKQIQEIVSHPDYDRSEALTRHLEIIRLERERLGGLIELVESMLRGEMNLNFGKLQEVRDMQDQYRDEVINRWGDTKEYRQSLTRKAEPDAQEKMNAIFRAFDQIRDQDPACDAAGELVEQLRAHITRNYYDCTPEIMKSLGRMYAQDERFTKNIDACGRAGLAEYVSSAIARH